MSIIENLPPTHNSDREETIIQAVKDNKAEYSFREITSTYKNHTARIWVFEDALKIEEIRVNVSARAEQMIADELGCSLMTAKICDLRYQQAKTIIPPRPRPISSTTKDMIAHSKAIDEQLEKINDPQIIATVGKHWILDNKLLNSKKPGMAINYGWHFRGSNYNGIKGNLPVCYRELPGVRMIQSRGTHHDMSHDDYSQVCVLVDRNCVVDGEPRDIIDIMKDPVLYNLVSHERMAVWRQPGVPDPGYVFIPMEPIIIN